MLAWPIWSCPCPTWPTSSCAVCTVRLASARPYAPLHTGRSNVSASTESLSYLRDLVYRRSAIVLEEDKQYLFDSRLSPVARESGFASIDELVVGMRRDPSGPLVRRVVEAMTTNETLFFRDVHPFEALKLRLVPELIRARSAERSLRI